MWALPAHIPKEWRKGRTLQCHFLVYCSSTRGTWPTSSNFRGQIPSFRGCFNLFIFWVSLGVFLPYFSFLVLFKFVYRFKVSFWLYKYVLSVWKSQSHFWIIIFLFFSFSNEFQCFSCLFKQNSNNTRSCIMNKILLLFFMFSSCITTSTVNKSSNLTYIHINSMSIQRKKSNSFPTLHLSYIKYTLTHGKHQLGIILEWSSIH